MVRLSVNVNKIATAAKFARRQHPTFAGGAHLPRRRMPRITVHPRPDARHITYQDVRELDAMLTVEFNIEGYPTADFLDLVCR